ncbi:MAG: hypothetical protein OXH49_05505 [Gemmatimonadetes bacterium]|nr:hypothetical protein [Gemmatimonadota bacterium]
MTGRPPGRARGQDLPAIWGPTGPLGETPVDLDPDGVPVPILMARRRRPPVAVHAIVLAVDAQRFAAQQRDALDVEDTQVYSY